MLFSVIVTLLMSLGAAPAERADALKSEQVAYLAHGIESAARANLGQWPVSRKERIALLVAVGWHETHFRLSVHDGFCQRWECDRGKARSPWQMHRNVHTEPVWERLVGYEYSATQAATALAMLRRSYWSCANSNAPWLQGTLNAYAGKRCDAVWPGLVERMATYQKVLNKL